MVAPTTVVVFLSERRRDVLDGDLPGFTICDRLYDRVKCDLHPTRHIQTQMLFDEVGDATFARLGVDSDDSLVAAANVGWVDGQIGNVPNLLLSRNFRLFPSDVLGFEALFDSVLV